MTSTCRTLDIRNRRGLHARAAAKFAATASRFQAEIEVGLGERRVNAKSIMGLMMLAAARGTAIEVCARGADAEAALEALAGLVDNLFEEDE